METSLVLIVLLFAALATGGLIVNWIGLGRAMSRLSVSAYIEFHQHTNRTFDPYMPIVVIGALAGGVALVVKYGVHSIPGQLAAAGAVCYALVIIIGLPTCVRINHQIARWSIQNPPPEWAQKCLPLPHKIPSRRSSLRRCIVTKNYCHLHRYCQRWSAQS
jgi:hypothetical protein